MAGVEITAEDINKWLSEKILESKLGEVVQDSVKRSLAELSRTHQNPMDTVIRNMMQDQARIMLQKPEYQERIQAAMKGVLDDMLKPENLKKVSETLAGAFDNALYKALDEKRY